MSDYPEHDKLTTVVAETQAAGEFVDWLGTQGIFLAKTYMYDRDDCITEDAGQMRRERTMPVAKTLTTLLAEWADIDQNKLEAEKRQMLATLRVPAPPTEGTDSND